MTYVEIFLMISFAMIIIIINVLFILIPVMAYFEVSSRFMKTASFCFIISTIVISILFDLAVLELFEVI